MIFGKVLRLSTLFVFFLFILVKNINADTNLSLYFLNDSVNGFKISDAYETHNMGLIVRNDDLFVQLDLGIVSPDMHIYKNEYRVANRSFGEIIALSFGKYQSLEQNLNLSYYAQIKSVGSFGIDKMQDFMHRVLTLQPVNYVNDLVRMPDQQWVGIGATLDFELDQEGIPVDLVGINTYLGSDRLEVAPFVQRTADYGKLDVSAEFGLRTIIYDEIVSAPPISASHRVFVPYFELGSSFDYFGLNWFIKDRFSLPTIKSDSGIFGVLHAGVSFDI